MKSIIIMVSETMNELNPARKYEGRVEDIWTAGEVCGRLSGPPTSTMRDATRGERARWEFTR